MTKIVRFALGLCAFAFLTYSAVPGLLRDTAHRPVRESLLALPASRCRWPCPALPMLGKQGSDRRRAPGEEHVRLQAHQLLSGSGETVPVASRETIIDAEVRPVGPAEALHGFEERRSLRSPLRIVLAGGHKNAEPAELARVLRARPAAMRPRRSPQSPPVASIDHLASQPTLCGRGAGVTYPAAAGTSPSSLGRFAAPRAGLPYAELRALMASCAVATAQLGLSHRLDRSSECIRCTSVARCKKNGK